MTDNENKRVTLDPDAPAAQPKKRRGRPPKLKPSELNPEYKRHTTGDSNRYTPPGRSTTIPGKAPEPERSYDEIAAEVAYEIAEKHARWAQMPDYGPGGKYSMPSTQMRLLEQDDTKRQYIAKTIYNLIEFRRMGMAKPVQNDEEMCERLNWYFEQCAESQQLITVEKMCIALGYAKDTVMQWKSGARPGFSQYTKDILRQAVELIAASDADLAQEGRIQPVVYLFRAKNFYNMSDKQEVVVTPNNPLGEYQDARTIEAKYQELPDVPELGE